MIELVLNITQVTVLLLCILVMTLNKRWPDNDFRFFYMGYFGTNLLANIYWLLYLAIFGFTPYYFYISDFSWIASSAFQMLFMMRLFRYEGTGPAHRLSWLGPAILLVPTIWFATMGGAILCLLYYLPMAATSYYCIAGILAKQGPRKENRGLFSHIYVISLAIVVMQNLLWVCSAFWKDYSVITNPYHWVTLAITALWVLLTLAVRRFTRVLTGQEASAR